MEFDIRRRSLRLTAGRRLATKRPNEGANALPRPAIQSEGAEGKEKQSLEGKCLVTFPVLTILPEEKDEWKKFSSPPMSSASSSSSSSLP